MIKNNTKETFMLLLIPLIAIIGLVGIHIVGKNIASYIAISVLMSGTLASMTFIFIRMMMAHNLDRNDYFKKKDKQ